MVTVATPLLSETLRYPYRATTPGTRLVLVCWRPMRWVRHSQGQLGQARTHSSAGRSGRAPAVSGDLAAVYVLCGDPATGHVLSVCGGYTAQPSSTALSMFPVQGLLRCHRR